MSKIEWTDVTWNPVRGCSRVSEGCRNCYAERIAARFSGEIESGETDERVGITSPQPFTGFAEMTPSGPCWTGRVELVESKLNEPLHWRKPRLVFVNSMSDLFHKALPDEAIDRVFAVMALCPQHTFQMVTKRAERLLRYFGTVHDHGLNRFDDVRKWMRLTSAGMLPEVDWPLGNVWLGVSVEDQATADERIPLLLQTPAAVRFVSVEPMLGPVDLKARLPRRLALSEIPGSALNDGAAEMWSHGLDWIIVGGESGPGARPMHPDWARSVRDQCQAAGVPVFFKQWGHFRPVGCSDAGSDDCIWAAVETADIERTAMVYRDGRVESGDEPPTEPGAWFMEPVGKKAAGRLLDGREWNEMPDVDRG